jgi:hypothetical protein
MSLGVLQSINYVIMLGLDCFTLLGKKAANIDLTV